MRKVLVILVVMLCSTAFGTPGDTWNLRDDFSVTNGNPNVVGNGRWEYMRNWNTPLPGTVTSWNGELPTVATGGAVWTDGAPGTHMVLGQYLSADGTNTTFNKDAGSPGNEVGGHGGFGVKFTSTNGGKFLVQAMGYVARGATGSPHPGQFLAFNGVSQGSWIGDIQTPIHPVNNVGWDNAAYSVVREIELGAYQQGDFVIIEIGAPDWAGFDVMITEIPEPATMAILGLGSLFAIRRKK